MVYDKIEDEKHILSECNLSPISENKFDFDEMVFSNDLEKKTQILNIYKGKKHGYY